MRTLSAITVLAVCMCTAMPSVAADIRSSSFDLCSIEISGPIEAGDTARLAAIANELGLIDNPDAIESKTRVEEAVCLNSPGGSYFEGILLADYLIANGFATRVRADSSCASACAIIFMAGRFAGYEGESPLRILELGGELGFHAPYSTVDVDEQFSGADVNDFNQFTSWLISDFISFSSYRSGWDMGPQYPMSLISEMLGTGPDDLRTVDTIEDVVRWGITLEGFQERVNLSDAHLVQACENFLNWTLDLPSEDVRNGWRPVESLHSLIGTTDYGRLVEIDLGGMEQRWCQINALNNPASSFGICSYDGFNQVGRGRCEDNIMLYVPWYYVLPPQTQVSALRG